MFDLDADLVTIHRHLAADPLMARLIAERPGLRVPGTWDGLELAIRAVLGQQITRGRGDQTGGETGGAIWRRPWLRRCGGLTHVFPAGGGVGGRRIWRRWGCRKAGAGRCRVWLRRCLMIRYCLSPGREGGVARLLALHGIGDWTAQYIALRQLREMDGFPNGDVGLINALAALEGGPADGSAVVGAG